MHALDGPFDAFVVDAQPEPEPHQPQAFAQQVALLPEPGRHGMPAHVPDPALGAGLDVDVDRDRSLPRGRQPGGGGAQPRQPAPAAPDLHFTVMARHAGTQVQAPDRHRQRFEIAAQQAREQRRESAAQRSIHTSVAIRPVRASRRCE